MVGNGETFWVESPHVEEVRVDTVRVEEVRVDAVRVGSGALSTRPACRRTCGIRYRALQPLRFTVAAVAVCCCSRCGLLLKFAVEGITKLLRRL